MHCNANALYELLSCLLDGLEEWLSIFGVAPEVVAAWELTTSRLAKPPLRLPAVLRQYVIFVVKIPAPSDY